MGFNVSHKKEITPAIVVQTQNGGVCSVFVRRSNKTHGVAAPVPITSSRQVREPAADGEQTFPLPERSPRGV